MASTAQKTRSQTDAGAGSIAAASSRGARRAYQACIPCRKRKARCDLGDDRNPIDPPCMRCRRERKECVFTAERTTPSSKRARTSRSESLEPVRQWVPQEESAESGQRVRWNTNATPSGTHSLPAKEAQSTAYAPLESPVQRPSHRHTNSQDGLANTMITTVISKPNDALNLLFEAAERQESEDRENSEQSERANRAERTDSFVVTPGSNHSNSAILSNYAHLPPASSQTLKIWSKFRFVRQNWFTAREANLSHLSPIVVHYFADHANHIELITQEPVLCCTILTLSSRYHALPGFGGVSRGFFIHDRLWRYTQSLFQRVMWGQDKGSKARTRTIGTIESFLLMTEWHPRHLHFPPDVDGWDADILYAADDSSAEQSSSRSASKRWLDEIVEPARRSDRMSWMLVGSALSLAHELALFDGGEEASLTATDDRTPESELDYMRRRRLRKLLFVFVNQLASRLGCSSMMPRTVSHSSFDPAATKYTSTWDNKWHVIMSCWTELTRLMKSASELLFPSKSQTRESLRNGKYLSQLEHFLPLLRKWQSDYLNLIEDKGPRDMLFIEYQYVRIYVNSLAVQAVVERTWSALSASGRPNVLITSVFERSSVDYEYISEVVDGSRKILETVLELSASGHLKYSPIRIFSRITSAAIFLLKTIGLGTTQEELQTSFNILDRSIMGLRSDVVDDMHLANRFATLLETHVNSLRERFIPSNSLPGDGSGLQNGGPMEQSSVPFNGVEMQQQMNPAPPLDGATPAAGGTLPDFQSDELLFLPFDMSTDPFRRTDWSDQPASFGMGGFDYMDFPM